MWRLTKSASLCLKRHCATVIQRRLRAGFPGLRVKTWGGTSERQLNAPKESGLPKRVSFALRSNVELRQSYSGSRENSNKKPPCAQKLKDGRRSARLRSTAPSARSTVSMRARKRQRGCESLHFSSPPSACPSRTWVNPSRIGTQDDCYRW